MESDIEEFKEKVDELTEMVKENQRMIRNLYRKSQWGTVMGIVKWVLIISISLGALYFLQPFLESTMRTYQTASGILSSMKGQPAAATSSSGSIFDLIKNFK